MVQSHSCTKYTHMHAYHLKCVLHIRELINIRRPILNLVRMSVRMDEKKKLWRFIRKQSFYIILVCVCVDVFTILFCYVCIFVCMSVLFLHPFYFIEEYGSCKCVLLALIDRIVTTYKKSEPYTSALSQADKK